MKVGSTFIKTQYFDILLPEEPANLLNVKASVRLNCFFTIGMLEVNSEEDHNALKLILWSQNLVASD